MNARPLVSVCMPAHRDSEMLRDAARSVLAQDLTDLELIISDDSGGGLRRAAEELDDPRIRYFANERQLGLGGNHTIAIERAQGELVAFLHDDDEWLPGYLSTYVEVLQRDPGVGIVCGDVWIDKGGPWERRACPEPGRYEDWMPVLMGHATFIPSSTVMRRAVWDARERDLPDLPVGDLILYIEAARTDWAMVWIGEPLVRYRMHAGNQSEAHAHRFRDGLVQVFDAYTFDDPAWEGPRRTRLARQLISRGGLSAREGDADAARADLRRAAELDPAAQRPRRVALEFLLEHPELRAQARRVRDLFPRR